MEWTVDVEERQLLATVDEEGVFAGCQRRVVRAFEGTDRRRLVQSSEKRTARFRVRSMPWCDIDVDLGEVVYHS